MQATLTLIDANFSECTAYVVRRPHSTSTNKKAQAHLAPAAVRVSCSTMQCTAQAHLAPAKPSLPWLLLPRARFLLNHAEHRSAPARKFGH